MGLPRPRLKLGSTLTSLGNNMAKGMGFKAAQANIAKKEGVSSKAAGAILASSTRKASAGAKKANPNLNKVKG